MGLHGDALLREARDTIKPLPEQSAKSDDAAPTNFNQLADAVEKAIKAALIENHGSLPAKHDHQKLVAICQNTGVWDVLPPALRTLVQEVEIYRATTLKSTQNSAEPASKREELKKYFGVTRRLIDYMEYHVIGNDSVLRRLKVA
ncbi:MAG TPA: HEPN domain-containing protein [Candidatus Binatia bacterium]